MTTSYEIRPIGHIESSLVDRDGAPKQGFEGAPDALLVFELGVSEGLRDLASVVDVGKISEIIGEQVRLASESEFATAFSDCEAEAMPPFGNLYDVPMYVDGALGQNERIVFQAGTHSVTVSVAYADFERLAGPTVADLAVAREA
jgi:hypothetical protein